MATSKKRLSAVAMALGRRIATLRAEAGFTQEALAERLGSNKSVLSKIETGVSIPSVQRIVEIADVLEVDLRALFDGVAPAAATELREMDIAEIGALLRRRPAEDARKVVEIVRVLTK